MGTVVFNEGERNEVCRQVFRSSLPHLILADQNQEDVLPLICNNISAGKGLILEVVGGVDPQVMSVLTGLAKSGMVNITSSDGSSIVVPATKGSFLILATDLDTYRSAGMQGLTTVCCNMAVERAVLQ